VTKSRRIRRVRHVAHMGGMRNACNILLGSPEGKSPIERFGCIWDIILRWMEIGVDWIHLLQDSVQWQALMNEQL
jgi:hypothetical protein